jgi:hypothetical protein
VGITSFPNVSAYPYNRNTTKGKTVIQYSNNDKDNLRYFSNDGAYGNALDIVVVDVSELDSHWSEMLEEFYDWKLPSFMRWYVDNATHDQMPAPYLACQICEMWEQGTEDEIIEMLNEEVK